MHTDQSEQFRPAAGMQSAWRAFGRGLTWGPPGILVGLLAAMLLDAPLTQPTLLVVLGAPNAVFATATVVAACRGSRFVWWAWSTLGSVIGTVLVAGAIIGMISGIAFMISDPG